MSAGHIELRGVRVHNLKSIDLDIPRRQLSVVCGVSGSGKTSLALDTLYAEGQRRYIESFSAYTRQFLDQFEKPAADRIDGIPPSIAVTRGPAAKSSRSTVGTTTELADYLRLLYAKIGQIHCHRCGRTVQADSAQSVAQRVEGLSAGKRFLLTFPLEIATTDQIDSVASALQEDGFVRVVAQGRLHNLAHGEPLSDSGNDENHDRLPILVVVDRLTTGQSSLPRLVDSIETAMSRGDGRCVLLVECAGDETPPPDPTLTVDDRRWQVLAFSESLRCEACGIDFSRPGAAVIELQQSAGGMPGMRRLWQHHRYRHGSGRSGHQQDDSRRCDRSLEFAGVCARTGRSCWPWLMTTSCQSMCRFAI